MDFRTDVVIVGTGVAGTFSALNLPKDKNIIMITKSDLESSDSFLAQGGICVLTDENDYDNYFEDTMKAGHYENRKESVDIMIRSSQEIIHDLIGYGVDFAHDGDKLLYTREGAHSRPRILFHEDITGQEITSKLLAQAKKLSEIEAAVAEGGISELVIPTDRCLAEYPALHAVSQADRYLHNGNPVAKELLLSKTDGSEEQNSSQRTSAAEVQHQPQTEQDGAIFRVYDSEQRFIGLYYRSDQGLYRPKKIFSLQ